MTKTNSEIHENLEYFALIEHENGIAELRIERQRKLNAINAPLIREMLEVSTTLSHDPPAALVLTSAGSRSFSIGLDLRWETWKENQDDPDEDDPELHQHVSYAKKSLETLDELAAPVIAAVQGDAYGGGFEIALSADLLVAGESTAVGLPEIEHGIHPAGGATQMLPPLVGEARAKELMFTGDRYSAGEVSDWGLFNDVVTDDEVESAAFDLAKRLAVNDRESFRAMKDSIRATRGRTDLGRELELATFDSALDDLHPEDEPFA